MIALYIRELDIKGGTHKQFYHLVNYLDRRSISFKIITHFYAPEKTYSAFSNYRDRIFCIQRKLASNPLIKFLYYLQFLLKLRKVLKGADILNIHDNGLQLLLPFLSPIKIIWQINDLPREFKVGVNQNIKSDLFDAFKRAYIKYSVKLFVSKVVVNVSKNRDLVKDTMSVNAEVIYCGIEKLEIQKNSTLAFQRFSSGRINLLSSGVFLPYRNYETLVKVVGNLYMDGIDVNLKIIGSTELNPEYTSKIRHLISQYGLGSRIDILGQIDEDRFLEVHRDSDVFLFLNIDQSWGLAVFEAMSCGIPVLVSKSVGATEILQDRIDAIFVDPLKDIVVAGEIKKIMKDSSLFLQLHNNGIAFADKYSWDNSYSIRMLELFTSISKNGFAA